MTDLAILGTFFWVVAGTLQSALTRKRNDLNNTAQSIQEEEREQSNEGEVRSVDQIEEDLKTRYQYIQYFIWGLFFLAIVSVALSLQFNTVHDLSPGINNFNRSIFRNSYILMTNQYMGSLVKYYSVS